MDPIPSLPRCSSALARTSSMHHQKMNPSLVLLPHVGGFGMPSTFGGLDQMIVSGRPAPVAVKEVRAPVIVSSPVPTTAVVLSASGSAKLKTLPPSQNGNPEADDTNSMGPVASAVSPTKPKLTKRYSVARVAPLAASIATPRADGTAAPSPSAAAGSGIAAVALLSSRGRERSISVKAAPQATTPSSTARGIPGVDELQAAMQATVGRSKSMCSSMQPRTASNAIGERSRSMQREPPTPAHQAASLSKTASAKISPATPAASTRRSTVVAASLDASTSNAASTPTQQGKPQVVKKYVVQANAYHSTFVQTMMMSRGPEWKPTLRCASILTANDIAQCDFVWFKYEFIKALPHMERQRVPAEVLEALKIRTSEYRALWNEGVSEMPVRGSGDALLKALDLLNAYVIPEAPEEPVDTSPLQNVKRTRLPSMLLCQNSIGHIVGAPPSGTPPEVVRHYEQLKPLLHYHHMKYSKGTPIVACLKNASAVWRKHMLYRYTKQFCDNNPEVRGSVRERMPATYEYNLADPSASEGARLFMTTLMAEAGVVRWLAKATGGANGNGFYVTKDPEDMIRYVSSQTCKGNQDADFWIIQEFVENMPLLFGGHRFHMKVHIVMIASPVGLEVYAYKRQRIQCCSEEWNPEVMAPLSYIGNWGQQRFATNLVQEKFSTLLEDIKGEYPKLLPAFHRAKQVIADSIEAAWRCGREHFQLQPGCYELMGWDFVMEECADGEWRPLLVEANHRPGFGSERKYMEKLIHEVLELVMHPINGLTKYVKETHNGVVEAIWDHVKTIVIDPMGVPIKPVTPAEVIPCDDVAEETDDQ